MPGLPRRLCKSFLPGCLGLAVLVSGCTPDYPEVVDLKLITSAGNELVIQAEVAAAGQEKRNGLMHRDVIGYNQGRLVVYPRPRKRGFSMRGARNAISVAYLDSSGTVQEISALIIDPNARYRSSEKGRYALQMREHWFRDHGVAPGDRVLIPEEIQHPAGR